MYVRIHVCICTFYRDQPWRYPVDVNNGVLVIYFDFEKGVFWSVNDLSSLFVDLYFALRRFSLKMAGCWMRAKILTSLYSRVTGLGTAGVITALSVF